MKSYNGGACIVAAESVCSEKQVRSALMSWLNERLGRSNEGDGAVNMRCRRLLLAKLLAGIKRGDSSRTDGRIAANTNHF